MHVPSDHLLAKLKDLEFLDRIAAKLRQATKDIEQETLPESMRMLLRRLESREQKAVAPPVEPPR